MVDSIYFTTATMLTVGYGDVHPVTDLGKLSAVIFMWFSVSYGIFMLFKFNEIRESYIDGHIKKFIKGKSKPKRI